MAVPSQAVVARQGQRLAAQMAARAHGRAAFEVFAGEATVAYRPTVVDGVPSGSVYVDGVRVDPGHEKKGPQEVAAVRSARLRLVTIHAHVNGSWDAAVRAAPMAGRPGQPGLA